MDTIKDDVLRTQNLIDYTLTSEFSQQLIDPKTFFEDVRFVAKVQLNTIRDMIIQAYNSE